MEFFLARQTMDPIGLVFSPSSIHVHGVCSASIKGDVDHSLESTTFFYRHQTSTRREKPILHKKRNKTGDTLVGDKQVVARRITMKNDSAHATTDI